MIDLILQKRLTKFSDCDPRSKVVIHLLCSTGMRIGAIPLLQIGHLTKTEFQNSILYKVQVYAGTRDKYYTFCTPECYNAIQEYLNYINDIILDALRDERKRMVIVNRTIDKIRPKLRDFPHERIDVVLCPFGRTELFAELEATLTRMPQGFE